MAFEDILATNFEMSLELALLMAWTIIWKGVGLWKAGRKNNLPMFLLILLINSAGIIPIGYLIYLRYSREDKVEPITKRGSAKRVSAPEGVSRRGKKKK
ncbi:hypothetical protein HN747_02615 [archaeon]|jgi:hypothetical protein|nr:hypothetical protein [archaeon]